MNVPSAVPAGQGRQIVLPLHVRQRQTGRAPIPRRTHNVEIGDVWRVVSKQHVVGVSPVASNEKAPESGISWENFRWIVGGGAAIIFALITFLYMGLRGDISDVKKATENNGLEIVKAIGSVEKQLAVTNTKLDAVDRQLGSTNSKLDAVERQLGTTNSKLDSVVGELKAARPR